MSVKVYLDGELVTTADEGTVSLWSKQVAPSEELKEFIRYSSLSVHGGGQTFGPEGLKNTPAHVLGTRNEDCSICKTFFDGVMQKFAEKMTTYPMNPPIPVVRGEAIKHETEPIPAITFLPADPTNLADVEAAADANAKLLSVTEEK